MAEFVQTMKDWCRMCKAQDDGSDRDVCATCPMGTGGCSAIYEDDGSMDYAHVEKVVTKWAAENPEPVYPNWSQWLVSIGVIPKEIDNSQYCAIIELGLITPIPADIAEKLGIEPKEDV